MGRSTFFQDELGAWWSSYFGSDNQAPWQEMPGVLPIGFGPDGRLGLKDASSLQETRPHGDVGGTGR